MSLIPKKFILGRRVESSDQMLGMIKPADNKTTKKYVKDYADVERYSLLPIIEIDNEPRVGFRIVGTQSYHRETWFKIEHPLGFIFTINSENMMDLIRSNDIVDVEFKNPLFFSEKMKLINYDSKIYGNLVKAAEKEKEKRRLQTEIKPNTYFTTKKYSTTHVFQYIGRFHMAGFGGGWNSTIPEKTSLLHVMYNITTQKFTVMSTFRLDVKFITRKESKSTLPEMSGEEAIQYLNERIVNKTFSTYDTDRYGMMFSAKPVKSTDIRITVTHEVPQDLNDPVRSKQGDVIKDGDDYYLIQSMSYNYGGSVWNRKIESCTARCYKIKEDGSIQHYITELRTGEFLTTYRYIVTKA